jgi:hypothetical protein
VWEAVDRFYYRGELCLPEARATLEATAAAGERVAALRFGEHVGEFEGLLEEFRAAVAG